MKSRREVIKSSAEEICEWVFIMSSTLEVIHIVEKLDDVVNGYIVDALDGLMCDEK